MMILSSINTSRLIFVLNIFCVICVITSCANNGLNYQRDPTHSDYEINVVDDKYKLIFYNDDRSILFSELYPKEPIVDRLDNCAYKVVFSTGSNSDYTYFVDIANRKISETYFNILFSDTEIVVYMENGIVLVTDIFNKEKKYIEISRDFSVTAVPQSAILSIDRNGSMLCIRYLKGENYEQVYEEIVLDTVP